MKIFSDTAGFAYNAIEENVKDKIDHLQEETGLATGDAEISADDILLDKRQFSL